MKTLRLFTLMAFVAPVLSLTALAADVLGGRRIIEQKPSIAPPPARLTVGQTYYTRFTFHSDDGKYVSTNYTRGDLVPINTAVTLVSINKDKIILKRNDTGQTIKVENEKKYTLKDGQGFAEMMLSPQKTPLDRLPAKVATAVAAGELHKGMTKELVLMTRGYPPAHETPSLDGDRWVYWSSRFVKLTIVFTDGRLSDGRGID